MLPPTPSLLSISLYLSSSLSLPLSLSFSFFLSLCPFLGGDQTIKTCCDDIYVKSFLRKNCHKIIRVCEFWPFAAWKNYQNIAWLQNRWRSRLRILVSALFYFWISLNVDSENLCFFWTWWSEKWSFYLNISSPKFEHCPMPLHASVGAYLGVYNWLYNSKIQNCDKPGLGAHHRSGLIDQCG